jgi:hypothetical protein
VILWQVPGVVPEPFLRAGARVPPQRRSNPVQGIRARARPRALAPLGAGVPPELSPCLAPALGPVPGWSPAYPGSPSVPSLWRCHERGPFEPESPHARGHRPALGFSLALGIACAISPVRGGVPSPFPGQGRGNTPPGPQGRALFSGRPIPRGLEPSRGDVLDAVVTSCSDVHCRTTGIGRPAELCIHPNKYLGQLQGKLEALQCTWEPKPPGLAGIVYRDPLHKTQWQEPKSRSCSQSRSSNSLQATSFC